MKIKRYARIAAGTAMALCLSVQVQASGGGKMDNDMLQELKRMIEQQQAQIDRQAAELAELRERLAGTDEVLALKVDKEEGLDKVVTSTFENVNLALYGQVNRALLYANNEDTSKWYSVDNINSNTRLGLRAIVDTDTGWIVGGRIEYGIVSNGSTNVNQFNTHDATSNNFQIRWAEVSFNSKEYGIVSLGKGDAASNNSTEVDLSGTAMAQFAEIHLMAASIPFYNEDTDTISTVEIGNSFSSFDGLSRTDRIRYDTPAYGGFFASGSASSGDAFDGALLFNRKFGGTLVAAAVAATNPGDLRSSAEAIYSGSASVLLPMGFNATFAASLVEQEDDDREDPTFWWTKLGYKTKFYEAASTAFSVEYGETADLRIEDETGKVWGVAAVHNIIDWGTEFYMTYRNYSLDSDEADFSDINAFWVGTRIKF